MRFHVADYDAATSDATTARGSFCLAAGHEIFDHHFPERAVVPASQVYPIPDSMTDLQGALVEATDDLRDGRADMEIADLFRSARPVLPSLILTGIVSAFIIGIGFLFLVIPGLIAMTFLAFVVPVVVKERASVGTAISRSISLVQGNFWSVFGLLLVLFIALVIVSGVLNWLVTAVVSGILGEWLANVISSVVCIPFFAVAITMAYFHLTEREPGTR